MSTTLYRKHRVLWLQPIKDGRFVSPPAKPCCADMRDATTFHCDMHEDPAECPDSLIVYNEIADEYGLAIHDGGASVLLIQHCPFCGAALPESKADRWFDEIEALGMTGPSDQRLPDKYRSAAWWRDAAL